MSSAPGSSERKARQTARALLVLGVLQLIALTLYLIAARGVPAVGEGAAIGVGLAYPFVFSALTWRGIAVRLSSLLATGFALCCTTAIVATTGGLASPFIPIFVTMPSASFSDDAAKGVLRLGLLAALGIAAVTLLDGLSLLPAYDIAPEMLGRARLLMLLHSVVVMVAVGAAAEVTRRRVMRSLGHAKENAEAANRAKSSFLAMMSHELRTPLAGMMGALSLAEEETRESQTRERLALASSAAESLRALLDDVLDFSRIEAGRLTIQPEPVAVATLIDEVRALFKPAAQAKGITLLATAHPGAERGVRVDALRMRQVLSNLVGNSIKFTDTGTITLEAWLEDRGAQRLLRVVVRDTGIGMNDEQLARLFAPFVQVHERGGGGGSGLGLVISRSIIEAMGGSLALRSERGAGTEARIEVLLPAAELSEAAPRPVVRANASSEGDATLRVLVAEDAPVLRRIIEAMLRKERCVVTFAHDGQEAVRIAGEERFDLILMDVHMPALDGLEATKRIRTIHSGTEKSTPIFGLSAGAFASHQQEALDAGMDGYLVKPVEIQALRGLLQRVRRGEVAPPPPPS